jgi:hypothetical protein
LKGEFESVSSYCNFKRCNQKTLSSVNTDFDTVNLHRPTLAAAAAAITAALAAKLGFSSSSSSYSYSSSSDSS